MPLRVYRQLQRNLHADSQREPQEELRGGFQESLQGNLRGDLQSDVPGKPPGDLQENLQRDLRGDLQGNLQGDLQGNLQGDLQKNLQIIGTLGGERRDNATFAYAEEYLASKGARPISHSLPLTGEVMKGDAIRPYFDGLLPEGPARQSLAAELGCREEDYPTLLARCGLDCIGDVIINPEAYRGTRSYEPVDLREIASRRPQSQAIARLLENSRLSIAGVQGKVGLFHDDSRGMRDGWYQPIGGAPSNAVVKFANDELPDLIELEYLCLAAARTCGIDAPAASLLFPERPILCVRRFDRMRASGETISGLAAPLRQHQEDFAQAFSISPGSKYAELEPSTIGAIASFLRDRSSRPAVDIGALARLAVFNYAIGNCDNHLKNVSLLYSPDWSAVRLAPAYDLISTAHYGSFSTEMGMRIGSTRSLEAVGAADILGLARQLGVSEKVLKRIAGEIAELAVPAFRRAADEIALDGFDDAPYLADELEEEFLPRLEVLRNAAGGR